MSVIILLILI